MLQCLLTCHRKTMKDQRVHISETSFGYIFEVSLRLCDDAKRRRKCRRKTIKDQRVQVKDLTLSDVRQWTMD